MSAVWLNNLLRLKPVLGRFRALSAPRLLVVRNDGLGDFILTLPLIASLKAQLPGCHLTVLVNPALLPLMPLLPDIDEAIGDEGCLLKRHAGGQDPAQRLASQRALGERLRAGGFDGVLVVYGESATARLVHRAGIPLRAGALRRPYFWRFNRFFSGSRKRSSLPEYQLNLGYLPTLGLEARSVRPRLELPPQPDSPAPYAVLHPYKRSGTALTWPLENFVALARELSAGKLKVRVIGDEEDRTVLEQWFTGLPGVAVTTGLSLAALTGLIARARVFIGNSSGPLHLAGLTGTPHLGFFPQDRVSAPARWRTLPHPDAPQNPRDYLLSSDFPKACVVCEGPRCPHFNCVASLGLEQARSALAAWGLPRAGS